MGSVRGVHDSERNSQDQAMAYEEIHRQRIKENAEKMRSLGISNKLFSSNTPKSKRKRVQPAPQEITSSPPRRSARLRNSPPEFIEKKEQPVPVLENPEVYTVDHMKLLGDSKKPWQVGIDGFDERGNRLYDSVNGITCHQCRQKTLGQRTQCNNCKSVNGKICGDCLYIRYGENLVEVKENPNWLCPYCRDICNCSVCRHRKGWKATGDVHHKDKGFKSVAHYLIHTRCENGIKTKTD